MVGQTDPRRPDFLIRGQIFIEFACSHRDNKIASRARLRDTNGFPRCWICGHECETVVAIEVPAFSLDDFGPLAS